jgi:hypothetical protein
MKHAKVVPWWCWEIQTSMVMINFIGFIPIVAVDGAFIDRRLMDAEGYGISRIAKLTKSTNE